MTPARIDDVLRSTPSLQANAAQILVDPRLGVARYTAAARSFDNLGWFIGTSGVGPAVPAGRRRASRAHAVRAPLAGGRGRLRLARRRVGGHQSNLAVRARGDLRRARPQAFPGPSGPAGVRACPSPKCGGSSGQGSALWAATDRGLARIATGDGRVDLLDQTRGLPDGVVYAVVSRQGRLTVGTRRGLVRVDDSLRVERLVPRFADPVLAVFPTGDSVWVGTQRGLLLALPGQQDVVRPSALAAASFQVPVVALASLGDTVVALTRDEMLWRNPSTANWTLGPNLSALLGALVAFAPDGPGFWVAGERGVAFARLASPPIRPLREGDLPGDSNDLTVDAEYLWVATDGGLVRFRLDAIRP